jgi:hypothetical protein
VSACQPIEVKPGTVVVATGSLGSRVVDFGDVSLLTSNGSFSCCAGRIM